MVVFTACLLAAIATGVTGALSSGLCNMFHSCAPRRSNRDDGDAVDEPAVQGDVPVQDESQQPLALSATSSSKDYIRSSDNNDNKGVALVLLPLQHGQQVLRLSSRASLDRLYNWASIPYPPSQHAVLHAAFERILLWSPGSNSAAQAPAATTMTTALIPSSSGPVPASRRFFSIIPDPAAITTHLHGMDPADGDHCVTEMMTTEALKWMLVVPSHQHYQEEQPPASYHTDGTSKAGGKCGFVPDGSAGTKTWSWSGELFGGQKATPTETGTAMKLQQFEETGGPVGGEMVSMMDVKGEEDAALKLKLESVDVSTTPPLTPASIPPSPAVTTSEEPGKNSSSFFADTYYDDGGSTSSNISISTSSSTGASSSEDEAASVRVQQRTIDVAQLDPPLRAPTELVNPEADVQAVQGSGAPLKKAKLRQVDTRAAEERTAAATEQGAGNNAEKFDPTKEREPGQLRQAFLKNLRRSKVGSFGDICVAVRVAQAALGGNEVDDGDLQRGDALGQGSFGIVWACRHTVLQGDFAVKMLKPDAAKEARYCATAEMIALTRLTKSPHENVVGAVAIDDRIERMSILFPQANSDLLTMLQHDCLSMLDKIRCLQQVSSGVGHMHELGIGHGDIKPANVLMYDNGQGGLWPKVCDFGMARGMGEERPAMMGTMGFMPPEVMSGETITHGSQDVWAMGVMAFLLCMSPDKALPNPFVSPELYTDREVWDKKALEDEGGDGCPSLAERRQHFEAKMTRRTMADGSCFKRLMAPDNLHPDLPTFQVKMTANLLILPFVDIEPTLRPGMACFEVVMGNFATEVEEAIDEQRAAEGETSEESDDVGLDLDGDDGGYEDNEFF